MDKIIEKNIKASLSLRTNFLGFPIWIWISFLSLALIKLWLVSEQSITALGDATFDDRLFINMAHSLLSFQWLGEYSQMTLAKGPFYPLWIAFSHFLGVPLLTSQHLLYIGACLLLILSLKLFLSSKPFLTIFSYVILLFNPASFADGIATRVTREGIYSSLTLLIIAFSFGLFLRFASNKKNAYLWSAGLGISLSCFWLTREEGTWILPLIAIIFLFLAIKIFIKYKKGENGIKQDLMVIILPFLILGFSLFSVSFINYEYYGIFNTVEFKNNDFLRAYGSLTRVENSNWQQYISVTKDTRMKIYGVSPSFAKLKPYLEGDLGSGWARNAIGKLNVDPSEIAGGWFLWAFRDAVAAAGYYKNGPETMNFYKQIADEIDTACNSGKLDCLKNNQSMTPHWRNEYLGQITPHFVDAVRQTFWFTNIKIIPNPSIGKKSSLELFQDITNEPIKTVVNQEGDQMEISGWAFDPSNKIMLSVVDNNDNIANSNIIITDGKDVYDAFSKQGILSDNALRSRFTITTNCTKDCFIMVNEKNGNNKKIPLLENNQNAGGSTDIFYNIDKVKQISGNSETTNQGNFKIKILEFIKSLYYYAFAPFLIISFLLLLRKLMTKKLKENNIILFIFSCSLLSIVMVRILLIVYIDITSFPAINSLYLSPAYPPLLIFLFLPLLFSLQKNLSKS